MNGLDALKIGRERKPNIPFIFVSGTIGEERAIESLRSGATDYVVKDRPASFVSKVKRALTEQDERSQRRALEEQYRQAQKLEAIGRLTGGVAHDFNNLLTVINGYTELVLGQMGQIHPMKADLEEVLAAGRRASGLTRQLLAFSRKQVTEPTLLDLNALVNNLQKMLGRLLGEDIQLAVHQEPALYRVVADSGQASRSS
jgi:signal transduction histidine kinase